MGSETGELRSKAEVLQILRRAGIGDATIKALDAELEDPVDTRRDGNLLLRHGITLDALMDRRGASP
jgi:hypothetical protein